MKHPFATLAVIVLLTLSVCVPALAHEGDSASAPGVSLQLQGLLGSVLKPATKSTVAPAPTTFVPNGKRLFVEQMVSQLTMPDDQKQQFRRYAEALMKVMENVYHDNGCPANDVSVALGYLLEVCYEIDHGTFQIGSLDKGSETPDTQRTRAVVRQFQRALGSMGGWSKLSDASRQGTYEACTFSMGQLVVNWQQAGKDEAKQKAVRESAREKIASLFRFDPDGLARNPVGEFVAKANDAEASVIATGDAGKTNANTPAIAKNEADAPTAKGAQVIPTTPLLPASTGGVKIFMKYRFEYAVTARTYFDHLLLFPDGTAFSAIPKEPLPHFSKAALRAALKPDEIGTWAQKGDTLVLNFPRSRDPQWTLRKHPLGWYAGSGPLEGDKDHDVYFPVIAPTRQQLMGAWKLDHYSYYGSMVPGDSSFAGHTEGALTFGDKAYMFALAGKNVFYGSTFGGGGEQFVGKINDIERDFQKGGEGRWRVDGPLLTLEKQGRPAVYVVFFLPHYDDKPGALPNLLLQGDHWQRPEDK